MQNMSADWNVRLEYIIICFKNVFIKKINCVLTGASGESSFFLREFFSDTKHAFELPFAFSVPYKYSLGVCSLLLNSEEWVIHSCALLFLKQSMPCRETVSQMYLAAVEVSCAFLVPTLLLFLTPCIIWHHSFLSNCVIKLPQKMTDPLLHRH